MKVSCFADPEETKKRNLKLPDLTRSATKSSLPTFIFTDKGSPPKFDRDMMFYAQHDEDTGEDVQVLEYVDTHVKSLDEK